MTDTARGEKKFNVCKIYIYKKPNKVTTYIRRLCNLKFLYLEDLGKYSRYISQVHYLPVNPYRLHAASTDTLHTVWSQEVHINRNEAYRSSIRLSQLRDTSSTYFKTKRCINTHPPLPATSKYIKESDYNKIWSLPTHFSHGFLENDNYKVQAEILKGAKMFPLERKIFHEMHAHIIRTENSMQSSLL